MSVRELSVLGIDYGKKRTGLALKQRGSEVVFAWGVLETDTALVDAIVSVVKEEHVDVLVVGMPFNTDGSPTHTTEAVKILTKELACKIPQPIEMVDERFTTTQAKKEVHRAVSIDERAACLIVEQYVNTHPQK